MDTARRQAGRHRGVGTSLQGASVALSGDGNIALVGGPADDGNLGAAWVFRRSGGTWTQWGPKLVGTGAVGIARQGSSIALSSDGNTALVGAGVVDNNNTGAAWVFVRGKAWIQQGAKLVGSGAVPSSSQGQSVALSADGNTAIVGGHLDNVNVGAVWVFARRNSGVWTQRGNKLVGTGAAGKAHQGTSVALSADGNTAIVGGSGDNSEAGAAWVFGRPGITDIDPNAGTVGGGTRVAIFGTNLFNVTGVTFGGVAATNVTPIDAETVLATTPSHSTGKRNVVVSTQTSGNTLLRRGYTYEPYPTASFLYSSANPSTVGQTVTFTAFVSGAGMPASGKVTFKDGIQALGTVDLTNGVAKFSTSALAAGRHTIRALFRRNGMFAPSKARLRQRVRN